MPRKTTMAFSKLDRLPLSAIQARQFVLGSSACDFWRLNPRRELLSPPANGAVRSFMPQLADDGARNPNFREELRQQVSATTSASSARQAARSQPFEIRQVLL
jgi:hypothetical protein